VNDVCPNCGAALAGRYCAECGQKRIDEHEYSLGHFLAHSLHDLTHLDAKIFGSIIPLVAKPGLVTRDYLEGRRGRYLRPLQTFIILNVIFFLLASQLGMFRMTSKMFLESRPLFFAIESRPLFEAKQRESGKTPEAFTEKVDERIDHLKRSLLLAIIPLFAAVIALLYIGSGRRYIEHLIFSIHFYSFWLIVTLAVPLAIVLVVKMFGFARHAITNAPSEKRYIPESPLIATMFFGCWIWLAAALRRVYGSGRLGAFVKSAVLALILIVLLLGFRDLVFLVAVLGA